LVVALILLTCLPKFKICKINNKTDHKYILYITQYTEAVRKKKERKRMKSYALKQMYFSVNKENATAWKLTTAVWRFRKTEQLPEDGQVRPKHT
jgi:hypothetical protein